MIGNLYDTIIVASLVKQWQTVFILQSIAVRKVLETVSSLLKSLFKSGFLSQGNRHMLPREVYEKCVLGCWWVGRLVEGN